MEFAQIIEAFIHGLTLVFQWQVLGFLLSGIMIGIVMGVIPGLGGIVGMVILLPFVYGMDPVPAFALFATDGSTSYEIKLASALNSIF